jgi:hypothetical protein
MNAEIARIHRDGLLLASDWTQLPDVDIDNRQAWTDYRQQLRDLPSNPAWPNVTFPDAPNA